LNNNVNRKRRIQEDENSDNNLDIQVLSTKKRNIIKKKYLIKKIFYKFIKKHTKNKKI